jgi:hypothetical protein
MCRTCPTRIFFAYYADDWIPLELRLMNTGWRFDVELIGKHLHAAPTGNTGVPRHHCKRTAPRKESV